MLLHRFQRGLLVWFGLVWLGNYARVDGAGMEMNVSRSIADEIGVSEVDGNSGPFSSPSGFPPFG